ncbi:MAG: DUF4173 domain-containing protein [Dehalococcoidia bacterium]|nr:DUF4173 domain-containing protein [Dehalococcoidia bacterium]
MQRTLQADRVTPRSRAALETVAAAAGLGLFADFLFHGAVLGLNAPIWVGALVAALVYTGRHRTHEPSRVEQACLVLALTAAAALAWRASPALQALLFLASGAFLVLAVAVRSGLPWRRVGVAVLAGALLAVGLAIAAGAYRAQSSVDLQHRVLRHWQQGARTLVRIVVIGLPVLLVFGLLFASADAVFEERLRWLGRFDLSRVLPHLAWFTMGAWFAGGVTWAAYEGQRFTVPEPRMPDERRLGTVEVATVLGLLAVLFGAFVAVQVRYLFGGHDVVQETLALTYAQYARRGFFELVTAAALLLPLLLVAGWARRHGRRSDAAYRVLAGLLVALLFVVMASALQRMRVYEQAYGLTEPRLYAVAALLWLAAVFALFLRTLLTMRHDWFVAGAVCCAALALAALTAAGPDGLIARRNIERASVEHPLDADYLAELSADAAPTLVGRLDALERRDASTVACALLERWGDGSGDGFRSWNWSRAAAARAVDEATEALRQTCDAASRRSAALEVTGAALRRGAHTLPEVLGPA